MPNVTDARDAMLGVEAEVASVLAEVEEEWTRPDMVMKLALSVAMMPPEALALLDDDTKNGIAEVLNAK